jgi:hypothetical protein
LREFGHFVSVTPDLNLPLSIGGDRLLTLDGIVGSHRRRAHPLALGNRGRKMDLLRFAKASPGQNHTRYD